MRIARLALPGVLAIAASVMVVHAAEEEEIQAARAFEAERNRDVLVKAGDPESLAMAALVSRSSEIDDTRHTDLDARAITAATNSPEFPWIQARLCFVTGACDPGTIDKLSTRYGDNAAVFAAMLPSPFGPDRDRIEAILQKMAGASRFDLNWNALSLHIAEAHRKAGVRSLLSASQDAARAELVLMMPLWMPISESCKGKLLETPERLDACRRISQIMRQGDTIFTQGVGQTIAARVWPETSAEYQDVLREQRELKYRVNRSTEYARDHPEDEESATWYLSVLRATQTEGDVLRAMLVRAGIDPAPPADWKEPPPHLGPPPYPAGEGR